jgi:hypothetical protein
MAEPFFSFRLTAQNYPDPIGDIKERPLLAI